MARANASVEATLFPDPFAHHRPVTFSFSIDLAEDFFVRLPLVELDYSVGDVCWVQLLGVGTDLTVDLDESEVDVFSKGFVEVQYYALLACLYC